MKWIGWPKEDDLWRPRRAGQMHRRGINRDEQARAFDQGREAEEIELPGKIQHGRVQFFSDSNEVRALELGAAAR